METLTESAPGATVVVKREQRQNIVQFMVYTLGVKIFNPYLFNLIFPTITFSTLSCGLKIFNPYRGAGAVSMVIIIFSPM